MLPVLFYLHVFSLFSFLSPNFPLWQSCSDNYRLGPNCQKPRMGKTTPPPTSLLCPGFLWQECLTYFLGNHTAGSTAVFLEPEAEGFCSPYGRLTFSLRERSISSSKWRCLACPFLFQQLTHTHPSDPVKTRWADAWSSFLSP